MSTDKHPGKESLAPAIFALVGAYIAVVVLSAFFVLIMAGGGPSRLGGGKQAQQWWEAHETPDLLAFHLVAFPVVFAVAFGCAVFSARPGVTAIACFVSSSIIYWLPLLDSWPHSWGLTLSTLPLLLIFPTISGLVAFFVRVGIRERPTEQL